MAANFTSILRLRPLRHQHHRPHLLQWVCLLSADAFSPLHLPGDADFAGLTQHRFGDMPLYSVKVNRRAQRKDTTGGTSLMQDPRENLSAIVSSGKLRMHQ